MLKQILLLSIALAVAFGSTACKKKQVVTKPGESVEEKLKLKNNVVKFYEQILKEYPDSPQAATARARLEVLKPGR